MTDETLLRIVAEIYDAAGSPDRWVVCLSSIRQLFGGTAAHLLQYDHRSHAGSISAAAGLEREALQAYAEHYHSVDPWALNVKLDTVSVGQVMLGQSVVSHAEMVKSEYYAGLGKPHDLTRVMTGFLSVPSATRSAVLSVNRSDRNDEFGPGDQRLLGILIPHVQRALALHLRLTNIDAHRTAAADVIDSLSVGVILVAADLRTILVNKSAGRLLAKRDGLTLENGRLRAATATLTNALRRMVASASAITQGVTVEVTDAAITLPRPSGAAPFPVVVTPLSRRNGYADEACAVAAVFITDPDRVLILDERVLQRLYDLTPAEARVAAAIVSGQSIDRVAESLRLTRGTVRWYVKQLLAKTGASTQAQLVRLLLSSPAVMQ
jgi:DNA-binding CsgD family transcriptional regulator